jgi:demethylmenaquinone methyltransferase/2-methoxy-6-polyprenyl-1,4-benzoquinol methylase
VTRSRRSGSEGIHGVGDVRFFDRLARLYDLVMPAADAGGLSDAFDLANVPVRRVLDVAGGSGRASLAIANRPDVERSIVVDVSSGMLERAFDRGLAAVRGDARELPVGSNAVDAAMVVDALHHVPDRDAALAEMYRAIRPGGVAVIREFDPSHPLGRLLAVGESVLGMGSTFVAPDELLAALEASGFDPVLLEEGFVYTAVGRVPTDGDDTDA